MAEAVPVSRSVTKVAKTKRIAQGNGFVANCLRLNTVGPGIDPFLSIDHFHMTQPIFPPHPHAGFSAVTYLFEDSESGLANRDSLGGQATIEPGSLHWTQAARGIVHEEVPTTPGRMSHGVQFFINLASVHKNSPPQVFHLAHAEVPEIREGTAARVRILVGRGYGKSSPLTPATTVTILDVHVAPEISIHHEIYQHASAFALMIKGTAQFGPMGATSAVAPAQVALFEPSGSFIEVAAGEAGAHYLLCSGLPLNEPIAARGPFVMNYDHELTRAAADLQAGLMGQLTPTY